MVALKGGVSKVFCSLTLAQAFREMESRRNNIPSKSANIGFIGYLFIFLTNESIHNAFHCLTFYARALREVDLRGELLDIPCSPIDPIMALLWPQWPQRLH